MASSSSISHVAAKSDAGLSATDHSVAGVVAQVTSKLVTYPLDTWKSRRQAPRTMSFTGLWTVRGMYRGVLPKLALYSPYQAVYMAVYVRARERLLPLDCGAATFVAAGVCAELAASIIRLPMEVSKLRLQLGIYGSTWHAAADFAARPGHFYGNFVPQTLSHDCVYSALSWLAFEQARQMIFASRGVPELSPSENLALGSATGAAVAAVTTPLDVLKTRIVSKPHGEGRGLWMAVLAIWRTEGPAAFWRGTVLRVVHIAPSHGLYMALYEVAKLQILAWRAS